MFMKRLRSVLVRKEEKTKISLIFVGLSNSGKTTLLNYLLHKEFKENLALTMGANTNAFSTNYFNYFCIDLGGQKSFRTLWRDHLVYATAIIFVLDAVNFADFNEVNTELLTLNGLLSDLGQKKLLLIVANKYDLPEAVELTKLRTMLFLENLTNFKYKLFNISVKTESNVAEAFHWLENELLKQKLQEI